MRIVSASDDGPRAWPLAAGALGALALLVWSGALLHLLVLQAGMLCWALGAAGRARAVARAFRLALTHLIVAVGTSLVVSPINQMLPLALRAGASAAILTASETPFDDLAEFRLTAPVEEVMPEVVDRIMG